MTLRKQKENSKRTYVILHFNKVLEEAIILCTIYKVIQENNKYKIKASGYLCRETKVI